MNELKNEKEIIEICTWNKDFPSAFEKYIGLEDHQDKDSDTKPTLEFLKEALENANEKFQDLVKYISLYKFAAIKISAEPMLRDYSVFKYPVEFGIFELEEIRECSVVSIDGHVVRLPQYPLAREGSKTPLSFIKYFNIQEKISYQNDLTLMKNLKYLQQQSIIANRINTDTDLDEALHAFNLKIGQLIHKIQKRNYIFFQEHAFSLESKSIVIDSETNDVKTLVSESMPYDHLPLIAESLIRHLDDMLLRYEETGELIGDLEKEIEAFEESQKKKKNLRSNFKSFLYEFADQIIYEKFYDKVVGNEGPIVIQTIPDPKHPHMPSRCINLQYIYEDLNDPEESFTTFNDKPLLSLEQKIVYPFRKGYPHTRIGEAYHFIIRKDEQSFMKDAIADITFAAWRVCPSIFEKPGRLQIIIDPPGKNGRLASVVRVR
jgi:hypothetical protein